VGEVVTMRSRDLTPGEPAREYRPASHKNAWRGHDRVIPLGPRAVAIIKDFLRPDHEGYLFDPRESVAEHHRRRSESRRSRPTPSELARRRGSRGGGGHAPRYDRRSYRQAIVRACDRAFPHPTLSGVAPTELTGEQRAELRRWRQEHRWCPLQLRHSAATLIRARYGLELTMVVLGHKKEDTTLRYAQRDLGRVRQIMGEIG
jgi:hypothetical protein